MRLLTIRMGALLTMFKTDPRVPMNINVYQQKKTVAQGMMDLALLSANANQLRYVLEMGPRHPYYYSNVVMIILSLVLQFQTDPRASMNINSYQHKKTVAQGMMDLALLSANANQLRYVLEMGLKHPYYYPNLFLVILSVILQLAVGIGLIMNSQYDIEEELHAHQANKINNYTLTGIFLITVINVLIAAFAIAPIQQSSTIHYTTVEQEPYSTT